MMFSRRDFLGGVLGSLTAWRAVRDAEEKLEAEENGWFDDDDEESSSSSESSSSFAFSCSPCSKIHVPGECEACYQRHIDYEQRGH